MSTTTTINARADNWLYEASPTSQYGGGDNIKIGIGGALEKRTGIFEFDVGSIVKPTDVVSAVFQLTENATAGSGANTITLARLSQNFTESTSNWNTYDGTNNWTTAGAEDDAELTEQTYTFVVGDNGDVDVDITGLVLDAVNLRGGTLRIICFYDGTPSSSGYSTFDSRTKSGGNFPKVVVTTAERFTWTGESSGDASFYRNWEVGGVNQLPTNNDYAIFNSGSVDVTTGDIACDSMFISKGYTGAIGTSSTPIYIDADGDRSISANKKLVINKTVGMFNLQAKTLTSQSVYISNCPTECKYTGSASPYACNITKTNSTLEIVGDSNLIACGTDAKRITLSGTVTDIKAKNTKLKLDNGCNDIVVGSGCRVICNSGTVNDVTIGGGFFTQKSTTTNDIVIYSGEYNFLYNDNATSDTGDVTIYGRGMFRGKSDSVDWTPQGNIIVYGGNFSVDADKQVTLS